MYEICRLLARKPAAKPRAPRKPTIKVGASVVVWGRDGRVLGKHPTNKSWWLIEVNGESVGFDRSAITVVG